MMITIKDIELRLEKAAACDGALVGEEEMQQISCVLAAELAGQEDSAAALLKAIDTDHDGVSLPVELLQAFTSQGREQLQAAQNLESTVRRCWTLHEEKKRRLVEKENSSSKSKEVDGGSRPWTAGSFSRLTILMADVMEGLKELQEKQKGNHKGGTTWVAPETFERSTSKYWVPEANLPQLLLTCVGEAPPLVYGLKTGPGQRLSQQATNRQSVVAARGGDLMWETMSCAVSSIYLDSASLNMYRGRLARREGAQLLRARWYGGRSASGGGSSFPAPTEHLHLELKTHHESWVNAKSVKERATILAGDWNIFLGITTDSSSSSTNAAGVLWNDDYAKQLLLKATPTLAGDKLTRAVDLLLRMRQLVVKKRLQPCVRSTYQRLAFQSSRSNSLRLTLDREVTLTDERPTPADPQRGSSMTTTACGPCVVPFAVLEIKLGENQTSNALDELIDKEVILDAAKFSKFLTGAAAFGKSNITALPYWANHPAFQEIFPITQSSSSSSIGCGVTYEDFNPKSSDQSSNILDASELSKDNSSSSSENGAPFSNRFARRRRSSLFSLTSTAMTEDSSMSTSRRSNKKKKMWIAPKKAVRVEPKSYFANERTFIQWISASLFLVTIGALLLEFPSANNQAMLVMSKVLTVFALLVAGYGLFLYYHRVHLMKTGKPHGYVSHGGPIILTAAVMVGVATILVYIDRTEGHSPTLVVDDGRVIQEEPNKCFKHHFEGLPALIFEPSDLFLDTKRNLLLVPSGSDIIAFPAPTWTEEGGLQAGGVGGVSSKHWWVAGSLKDADIEAITGDADSSLLFVASEEKIAGSAGGWDSRLYALEWVTQVDLNEQDNEKPSSKLVDVGNWIVGPPLSEGITLVEDPSGQTDPELFISGNIGIETFSLPALNGQSAEPYKLEKKKALNGKLLTHGLSDPKIGAMTTFEGIVYILHDNGQVIRAWDMTTGLLLATIPLPRVGDGYDKQWEGIALQRVTVPSRPSSSASLRGSSNSETTTEDGASSVLLLHLALDTPAAIWTLVVQEGAKPGEMILPDCAAVASSVGGGEPILFD